MDETTNRRVIAVARLTACLAIAGSSGVVVAQPSAGSSNIVAVTVFPDRGEIVRELLASVPAGASTVEFTGLPQLLEPDSLRVSARGVPAALGAVELRQEAREPEPSPEYLAAEQTVHELEGEIRVVDGESGIDSDLREFLKALRATTATRESEALGEGRADPASIAAVYDLVRERMSAINRDANERQLRRQKLAEDLQVAQAKLAALRPEGPIRYRTAEVEIEAKQAGTLTVRLEYVAHGAGWRPAYRASLDAATGRIALDSEAVVHQSTGEDWSGVALRLSTASPARGTEPPELTPWLLRPLEVENSGRAQDEFAPVREKAESMSKPRAMAPPAAAAPPPVEAERPQASLARSAYNLAFEVPGTSDVPADGNEHRIALRQDSLEGEVRYRAVPAINAAAFLVAKAKTPEAYPLLAGPVRVFAGGAYLGSFQLEESGPGTQRTFPFGVDNRVTVERVPLPRFHERSGIFGKEKRVSYGFRTTIENLRDVPITVIVEESVPVSEDERIRVEIDADTTPGRTEVKDRPGVMQWELEIAPRAKSEVHLAYTIRFPKDLNVPGVD